MFANEKKPSDPDYWPCSPEEFTRKIEHPAPYDGKNGPNTTATSPGSQLGAFDLVPSTPDATRDNVLVSSPLLLTTPLTEANLAILISELNKRPGKNNKHAGPPAGGYKSNKLDFDLKLKVKGPIRVKDGRGPNSDLGGGEEYEGEVKDRNGDVVMQETVWTSPGKTSFLVSVSLFHSETAAHRLQKNKYTTVLISSTMPGIPSLVVTAPDHSILPDPITRTMAPLPRRMITRETSSMRDIPVLSNRIWAPVCAKRKKGDQ